ncbi:MAG: tripartite tricarboxylate transporter substrate binding protein [Rubrivivax sp.]|nr:tripartite tricarboxylate transporter substrate binding protein [Rubrivivax sp.]
MKDTRSMLRAASRCTPTPGRRTLLLAAAAAAAGAAVSRQARAQAPAYPARTVSIVVPFGPGNAYDMMVRFLAERLQEATGQPFIVEARQGALGGVAASFVARSAPDGHTLLLGANSTHAANVHLFKKLQYDPVADFAPVTTLATIPQVLVVSPGLKVNTLAELVALARSQPGKLNYGSSSATGRVATEALRQQAGIDAAHVPYKTSAQAITDLISGQLHFLVTDMALGVAQAQAGKVKALAITSPRRVPAAADLPTVAEAGLPGYEFTAWLALFAPAKTPAAVVNRIAELANGIVRSPAMADYLARMYALPFPGTPESLRQLIERDTARWGLLVKAAGIEPE